MLIGSVPPPVHGVSLYLSRLLNSSLKKKINLVHFDISDHRDLTNIGSFDFRNIVLACIQLVRLTGSLLSKKYDFVYIPIYMNFAGFLRDSFFVFIVRVFSNAKILPHFHCDRMNYFYKDAPLYYKWYINFSFKKFDDAIVMSQGLKKDMLRWFRSENIHVLSNGLDVRWEIRKKIFTGRDVQLGFLGNLVPKKGVLEAVKAFHLICDEFPNVSLKIGGHWNLKYIYFEKDIREYILSHHLNDKIRFVGAVGEGDKEKFFGETDIFISPSWTEGMPTVIIEAMAAGCPVISTNVGAIPEMVEDGRNGFLLDAGDIGGMADRLRFFLTNPQEIIRMGEESRKIYRDQYTFKMVQQDFEILLGLNS